MSTVLGTLLFPVPFSFGKEQTAVQALRNLEKRKGEHLTQVRGGETNHMIPFQNQAKGRSNKTLCSVKTENSIMFNPLTLASSSSLALTHCDQWEEVEA